MTKEIETKIKALVAQEKAIISMQEEVDKTMKQAIPQDLLDKLEQLQKEKDEIQAQIFSHTKDIYEEFSEKFQIAEQVKSAIEIEIKSLVEKSGSSFKLNGLYHAIYRKASRTYDTDKMDGYAAAHPEVKDFVKIGTPSVSLKRLWE